MLAAVTISPHPNLATRILEATADDLDHHAEIELVIHEIHDR